MRRSNDKAALADASSRRYRASGKTFFDKPPATVTEG
jgi:hypothetical protein